MAYIIKYRITELFKGQIKKVAFNNPLPIKSWEDILFQDILKCLNSHSSLTDNERQDFKDFYYDCLDNDQLFGSKATAKRFDDMDRLIVDMQNKA